MANETGEIEGEIMEEEQPHEPEKKHYDRDMDEFTQIKISDNLETGIDLLENNGTTYVAGYFAFKLFKKHDCEECRQDLKNHGIVTPSNIYSRLRQFQEIKNGGLFLPSDHWIKYIKDLEDLLIKNLYTLMYEKNVLYKIFCILKEVQIDFKCEHFPKIYFLKLFIRIRLYYIILFANRSLKTNSKNQKYLKITNQI